MDTLHILDIVLGVLVSVIAYLFKQREKAINDRIDKLAEQSKEHFLHAANDDAHWTKRERDLLMFDVNEIKHDLKQALSKKGHI